MTPSPDIIARVSMFATGPRVHKTIVLHEDVPPGRFGCPLVFRGEAFDCWLLPDPGGAFLSPGTVTTVRIVFCCPKLIKPRLRRGDRFTLWEAGDFAEGEVFEVID